MVEIRRYAKAVSPKDFETRTQLKKPSILKCETCQKGFSYKISLDLKQTKVREEWHGTTYESIIICPLCERISGHRLVSYISKDKMKTDVGIGGTD